MKRDRFHILITTDKGITRRFSLPKNHCIRIGLSCVLAVIVLLGTFLAACHLFSRNRHLEQDIAALQERIATSDGIIAEYSKKASEENEKLGMQVTDLQIDKEKQSADFKAEKEKLLSTTIYELRSRSELIEQLMEQIGIKIAATHDRKNKLNSGGPFIAKGSPAHEALLNTTDVYLKAIKYVPLGSPTTGGEIVSDFGARQDPVNNKDSFHAGLDFSGNTGDAVFATAMGKVQTASWNGSYGNYVEIDHQNGYSTCYAHLEKFSAKPGDTVKRGQLIGSVGSTGRTTGPHLHYEIHYQDNPIDPKKFTQVAELLRPDTQNKK